MALNNFLNRCIWFATAAGLSDFTVGSAAQNGYIPADCLDPVVVDGEVYHYFAQVGTEHEEGDGIFSGGVLARTTIRNSSNAGAKVNFSAIPTVFMGGPIATDMAIIADSNKTWYVATTGSDTTGDGSAGNPWATIQHAVDVAGTYDWRGLYFPTINVATGTYTYTLGPSIPLVSLPPLLGFRTDGSVLAKITGDLTTPSNVKIVNLGSVGNTAPIFSCASGGSQWQVGGFRIDTPGTSYLAINNTVLNVDITEFDDSSGGGTNVPFMANTFSNIYTFSATNATFTILCPLIDYFAFAGFSSTIVIESWTINLPAGGLAANDYFLYSTDNSTIYWLGNTVSNANLVTGTKATIAYHSLIEVDNGFTDIPGSTLCKIDYTSDLIIYNGVSSTYNYVGYRKDIPGNGATISMALEQVAELLVPAAGLATLTVNLPPASHDGQIASISSTRAIAAITVATTDGSAVVAAPSALLAGQTFKMLYDLADNSWYPTA